MEGVLEITGYVNVAERDSVVLPARYGKNAPGDFVERVQTRAFQQAILKREVSLMVDHKRIVGNMKDGVLRLVEDGIGLRATIKTSDSEIVQAARERKIKGWSFGFNSVRDDWKKIENGLFRRTLKRVDLLEVSILIAENPAYPAVSADLNDGSSALVERRIWQAPGDPVVKALEAKGLLMKISKLK